MIEDHPVDAKERRPQRTLDMIGFFCPEPVFRARQTMDEMNQGEILEVQADDPAAEEDMISWTRRSGQELILVKKHENTFKFLIRKVK